MAQLLALHVTMALALTILLGMQCLGLARIRATGRTGGDSAHVPTSVVAAIPPLAVAVAVTGGALLGAGARGGPWIGAGVFSSVVITASAVWTLFALRSPAPAQGYRQRLLAAVQWGSPAFTLAAAYLMAARPDGAAPALVPVVLALAITATACARARTTNTTRSASLQP
jgi:hypothetical protein